MTSISIARLTSVSVPVSVNSTAPAMLYLAGKPATNPGKSGNTGNAGYSGKSSGSGLGGALNKGMTAQQGFRKAGQIANPANNARKPADRQTLQQTTPPNTAIDTTFKPLIIKLDSDRRVVLRARKDGSVFIDVPNQFDLRGKRVSWNVTGINTKATPEQIQQAIKKLCSDPRKIPYVFDSGMRTKANMIDKGPNGPKSFLEQRKEFENAIKSYPPLIKELVGAAGGVWFETLGKLGYSAVQVTNAQQEIAKKITASPTAWRKFIDTSFEGNDQYAKDCRKYLGDIPKGGPNDAKTTLAIFLALDRKAAIKLKDLGLAIKNDPVGVAFKTVQGIKAMIKEEGKELQDTANIGIFLGTLAAKLATSWIPMARGGAAGAKLFASLLKNSPKLLKTMGTTGYKAAIATLQKADAQLITLAAKAKTGTGLSAAEKAQKTGLTNQITSAAMAIADGNENKLNAAVDKTNALLSNKKNVTGPTAQQSPLNLDPPGALVHQPKVVQIPEVESVLINRIAGPHALTETQRYSAVQNIMDYPGRGVTTRRETVERWADDAARSLRETAESLGFAPNQVPLPYQNLTRSELAAIQFWTGKGFRPAKASVIEPREISASQSKYGAGDGAYVRAAGQYANVLDNTLAKLPKVRGTFIRHDTVSAELLAKYKVNSTIEWPTFSSASADTGVFTTRNCKFEIEGNPVDLRGFNPWEREVIFRPGSQFKVLSIEHSATEAGKTVIKLKQVK